MLAADPLAGIRFPGAAYCFDGSFFRWIVLKASSSWGLSTASFNCLKESGAGDRVLPVSLMMPYRAVNQPWQQNAARQVWSTTTRDGSCLYPSRLGIVQDSQDLVKMPFIRLRAYKPPPSAVLLTPGFWVQNFGFSEPFMLLPIWQLGRGQGRPDPAPADWLPLPASVLTTQPRAWTALPSNPLWQPMLRYANVGQEAPLGGLVSARND